MIRGNTISFSSYKKKTTSERELFLLRKIRRLEDRNCISDTAREELQMLNNELEALLDARLTGCIIRSRAQ